MGMLATAHGRKEHSEYKMLLFPVGNITTLEYGAM
jgi:hypothetical protein